MKVFRLCSKMILILMMLGVLPVQAQSTLPEGNHSYKQNATIQAVDSIPDGWTTYNDPVYGYRVQFPAPWYVYPTNGDQGSPTVLSSYDRALTPPTEGAVMIEISLASYDRYPNVALADWIAFPEDLQNRISIDTSQPSILSDGMVVHSYTSNEGNSRRAYIARGPKTYIIDMITYDPLQLSLFTSILESFAFTEQVFPASTMRQQLYSPYNHLYLPFIANQSNGRLSADTYQAEGSIHGVATPQNVPGNYRLPFIVGPRQITQGPGCWVTHINSDFEAIDFGLSTGTAVYATESGVLTRYVNINDYGNTIKIVHPDGRTSWYSHLVQFIAPNGPVNKEDLIGLSGGGPNDPGRGTSTGSHLHFMVLAPNSRVAEWIRDLTGITWYSGSSNVPCVDGYDGSATGPALSAGAPPPEICQIPALSSPGDGYIFPSAAVQFSWETAGCATNGYQLRIRTSADMENGGGVMPDAFTSNGYWSGSLSSAWYGQDLFWSVKAANSPGAQWLPARRFQISASPVTSCPAPDLYSPTNDAIFSNETITFSWGDVSCPHSGFTFKIKNSPNMDSGGSDVYVVDNGTNQRTVSIGAQWYNQDLYWSVKAANSSSAAWAASRHFRINTTTVPNMPTLVSPSNGENLGQNSDISLSWNPVPNSSQYKVELWGGVYSLMTVCDWQSGTACHIGTMWPGIMYWHVKMRNGSGQESDWSSTWSFTVQQSQPQVGVPLLNNPTNNASLAQNTDVTLYWNSSVNATDYTVEVWGSVYSKMTPCNWQSGTSCHIGVMWPGTVYWHVKARDSSGQETGWSDTWSFVIQESTPEAGKPTLSSPSNGASLAQSTDITLVWNSSSGATQYKVELWGGPYSLMTPCDWQSGTSCHIGTMWPGTMYWHVKARDGSGQESDWSDTWSFIIQDAPSGPDKPTLSNPGNGSSLASNTDVTLSWNTAFNATQYKVELWGGPYSLMTPCDWQSGTSCHIGTMWPGTMYWHAKARNGSGQESDWSDTWSFTIQEAPPTWKPTLSSPANGSSHAQSTDITLYWNSLSGATQYKVELWGGPYSLMTPCDWQAGTSCHIGTMWPGTMSWHVKARDSTGTESDWSDTWTFTIQN
jgi:murein DD-endopeptidase MepM/ murein hydrolase activator NlpD